MALLSVSFALAWVERWSVTTATGYLTLLTILVGLSLGLAVFDRISSAAVLSSSPTLYEDMLILLCDHAQASYLLGVDKRTGKDRWRADRGKGRTSYSTPFIVRASSGPELIVNSSERVDAYDPRDGTFLWHVGGSNQYPIPVPTFGNGVIYMTRGYRSGPYMAVKPGGRGDVSASHVVWQVPTGAPYISSLVYDAGLLYMGATSARSR